MQTYEYQTLAFDCPVGFFSPHELKQEAFTTALNHWGAQGWELVSVVGFNRYGGDTNQMIAVFKRTATPPVPPAEKKWLKLEPSEVTWVEPSS
ncbi:hypothetical protein ETAA8_67450 [Anatilimnocola aggregata]|uniref:DUF4177 domain-containing protein n=1 Tax=Anatilimnocola aggregata TaxID=2528021 RepID=A0A517YMZ1_9BACT|nr:DUF4177 domain-containing protein [Anatilimnocola aggregata]QDU31585.1 hypothetical protein ETAA8_67450 [Anatilimnocola aggregata]